MVPDDDCTMWTLGQFCRPPLTPDEVFERTDYMAGPWHPPEAVADMVQKLNLGNGHYATFNVWPAAQAFMQSSMMERFAFGVKPQAPGSVGHMVNAFRDAGGGIQFIDYQPGPHNGIAWNPPINMAAVEYFVWPINDDM